jgi:DNA polymerase III alpha subunit
MRLDKFSNPVFSEQDLFDALYQGHQIIPTVPMFVDASEETAQLEKTLEFQFVPLINDEFSKEEFDRALQEDWFMPEEYLTMDIEKFLVDVCPAENYQRLVDELTAFKDRNMLNVLKWLKYFVDTCEKEDVLWGVGRGSSVASYVLYLIGVHSVDPIKYKLDWREFLR